MVPEQMRIILSPGMHFSIPVFAILVVEPMQHPFYSTHWPVVQVNSYIGLIGSCHNLFPYSLDL